MPTMPCPWCLPPITGCRTSTAGGTGSAATCPGCDGSNNYTFANSFDALSVLDNVRVAEEQAGAGWLVKDFFPPSGEGERRALISA